MSEQHSLADIKRKMQNPRYDVFPPKRKKRRWWKILVAVLLFIFIGSLGWVGYAGWNAIKNITSGSGDNSFLHFITHPKPSNLAGENEGRINILIIGIGGENHPGGMLADSIMVASIDTRNNKIALISLPRDLYVPIPGAGYNKINYAHAYGESNAKTTGGGPVEMKKTVNGVLDIPIHYYVRTDFTAFRKLVDAIGGVDVNVPTAIYDPLYPDERMVGYSPFRVSKGMNHFDGTTALKYARSRETTSDFDRAKRQQLLLMAIRDKTLSMGVLGNPKRVVDILNILGDHVKTDLSIQEMEHLTQLSQKFDSKNVKNIVFETGSNGVLVSSTSASVGYYLKPRTGDFKEIQKIVKEVFQSSSNAASEQAVIEVRNATGVSGQATSVVNQLKGYGYQATPNVNSFETAGSTVLYDYTDGKKKFTSDFLTQNYKATVIKNSPVEGDKTDFILVLGSSYLTLAKNTGN